MARANNFHEDLRRGETIRQTSNRRFGALFTLVFMVAGLSPLWRHEEVLWWSLAVSALFGLLTLIAPQLLAPLNYIWFRFGQLLHRIVSPLVMAVMFYGVVTPAGMLLRLAGKDPLHLKKDPRSTSYWIRRDPPGPSADGFPRMY
jgi:hypothetical protein